jgi:putative ABC transport system substrate-binding protein
MDRRTFIGTFAGSLLAVPHIANAQQANKIYRIGLLTVGIGPLQTPFWDAMREFGWVEGQNVKIEPRYAVSDDQLPARAAELVQIKVDLIMASGTPAAQAAKLATKTIPIVFAVASDPVKNGLVASLARPGGNLTGFVWGVYEEKLLEILKAALPGISRVAYPVVFGAPDPAIQRAAKALGVQVNGIAVNGPQDFGPFYTAARKAGADAVVIQDVAWFLPHLEHIAAESAKSRLPAIGFRRIFAEAGGLLSYGPTIQAAPRLAAQIDKILKGTKPADLPVEQPTTFELVINLKTAKTLGLTISQPVLLRATEVIQ